MANYEVIKRLDNYQYIEGCPVFITGGNLIKETESEDMFVNIRLRSLSEKVINAVFIDVNCYSIDNTPLEGVSKHQILDLNIKSGETFADNKLIKCPNNNTRKCQVIIKKVFFSDETKWELSDSDTTESFGLQIRFSNWRSKSLSNILFNEINDMNYPKHKVAYVPNQCGDYWICTCGLINKNDHDCICGFNKDKVFELFNEEYLMELENDYREKLKISEEDRQRQLELAEKREEERRIRQRNDELERLREEDHKNKLKKREARD